jgi:hypothetical protein
MHINTGLCIGALYYDAKHAIELVDLLAMNRIVRNSDCFGFSQRTRDKCILFGERRSQIPRSHFLDFF